MWEAMKEWMQGHYMSRMDLRNPGMELYHQRNTVTMDTIVVWMITDREMSRMNRIQYQEYLAAIHTQFQDRIPQLQIVTILLTDDWAYAEDLCSGLEPTRYHYWVVNPISGQISPDPWLLADPFRWLRPELQALVEEEKDRVAAGVASPDWLEKSLWRDHQAGAMMKTQVSRGKRLTRSKVTLALIGVNLVVFLFCLVIWIEELFSGKYEPVILGYVAGLTKTSEFGGASWYTAVECGQVYRFLTSIFFHAGFDHLTGNMIALFAFGDAVETYITRGKYFALYMIAGLGSAFCATTWRYVVQGDAHMFGVGASGAIFGLMGAELVLLLRHPEVRKSKHGLPIWAIPAYVAYSILVPILTAQMLDSETNIDLAAHVSGFIIGAIIFYIFDTRKKEQEAV